MNVSEVASSETGAVHGIIVGQVSQEAVRYKLLPKGRNMCYTKHFPMWPGYYGAVELSKDCQPPNFEKCIN